MRVSTEFRADINGLRAWAVVAVVLYHFGVAGFSGGFVGVDIFFVISGLLMTRIVVRGLERNDSGFSIWSFYIARAQRILPALIFLCAVLLLVGWWLLPSPDYKVLGKHITSSLTFLSNVVFVREAGYFDASSHDKWLLHTWSLSVEWQFYIVLPLVLRAIWIWKPTARALLGAMTLGFVISLALSTVVTLWRPSIAFYLLPTRAWEMLAGGLAYMITRKWSTSDRNSLGLESVGFALIVLSIARFDSSSAWPGLNALFPVVGTAFVLAAARKNSSLTGNRVAQWIGTRSYSIYLWHWPLVVALVYLEWQDSVTAIAVGIASAFLLGHFSYLAIETPSRRLFGRQTKANALGALAAASVVVAAPAIVIFMMAGAPGRVNADAELAALEALNSNPRQTACVGSIDSPSCVHGGSNVRAILIGDSHGNAVISSLAAAAPLAEDGVIEWTAPSCPTIFGVKSVGGRGQIGGRCDEFLEWTKAKLESVPRDVPIVIVNRSSVYIVGHNEPSENDENTPLVYFGKRYVTSTPEAQSEYSSQLAATACEYAKDRPVFLMRPIPEMGIDVPKTTSRSLLYKGREREVAVSLQEYHKRHRAAWAGQNLAQAQCSVKILDPLPYLCKDGLCRGTANGRPIYYDDDHLSEYGNKLLKPMFAAVFGAATASRVLSEGN